ncbi:putative membrane protein [Escherichia coli DEC2C]|uniref:Putative membrane protein n=1 Tax=Escherichia coli DEC2D TaxID=868141 RepID=A0A828U427_ECOLX|nr:putative membrane protein [Escherichia coli DEC1C]EHU37764.1 putative membrane protein [Escherichia coli DEC2C]EHU39880.1 putative membrane protein [Escherichia coli DEC2D]
MRVSRSLTIKQMAMVAAVVLVFVLFLHRFAVPSGPAESL